MKGLFASLLRILFSFLFILFFIGYSLEQKQNQLGEHSSIDELSPDLIADHKKLLSPSSIYGQGMHILSNNEHLSERTLKHSIAKNDGVDSILIYSRHGLTELFASAPNIENHHQLVNSYLEGYSPFETDNLWIPYLTLSRKKSYQFDHLLYPGRNEVWQTSRQAFSFSRGDCEDHAIALADWLIEMGEDARVVMGHYKREGHAWVVLFKNGKEFLLEATQKVNGFSVRRYPLALLSGDYRPKYMFNRHDFWVNEGSVYTHNYSSPQWVLKSSYQI